jgi:diketogulonate reductase-like aldo/keto reductase
MPAANVAGDGTRALMKFETTGNTTLPKIGFGTWLIGGEESPNPAVDDKSLRALRSALELGYTHFDTAEHYARGHAEELLGQAVRQSALPRERLFITSKVWPNHMKYEDVMKSCEASLRRLGMDYIDLYLIHWHNPLVPLKETFRAMNQLVHEGKVRHLGISNFGIREIKQSQRLAETPIVTNQVSYSLHDRSQVKNGVLAYCQQNGILITAYTPIENGRLKRHSALQSIASAHNASIYQVALAWLVSQPCVIAIPMSFERGHQAENLAAADLVLSPEEIEQLNNI